MKIISSETKEETPSNPAITYLRIPVPSLKSKFAPFYVLLLVVLAFLAGALFQKYQYIKFNAATLGANIQGTAQAAQINQPNNKPQPTVPAQKVTVDNGHFPVEGDPNAKVTIVAFEDLRCPFCKQWFDNTLPSIKKDYIDTGKAKLYFRQYEFLGDASVLAGNAAECANDQGKFWDFYNYMYQNQPSESDTSMFTVDKLTNIAGTLGMDTNQFNSCLSSKKFNSSVSDDLAAGQKAGVSGTPTVFVNGVPIVGAEPYSTFQTAIDAALK